MEDCLNTIIPKISPDMQLVLSSAFSVDEVKTSLFQVGARKMNALFHQKFWYVVGDMVINAVLDFLNFEYMVPKINYTHIVLIPKIKSHEFFFFDFQPISLCNVIYKIIFKVLANRLKQILSYIISLT